jgi:hypothetical protein
MPQNDIQWAWFLFFGLGSIGGIAFLVSLVRDLIATINIARTRRRL